jgi:DNA-binding PadR family transcriptional regulator
MMKENHQADLFEKLTQELRRGVLILAVLSRLDKERYGYDLINRLGERGLEIEQGTLYPLLRRLESQELLTSEWNVEGSRPRRYYVLSPQGREMLKALTGEWRRLAAVMEKLLEDISPGGGNHESD